MTGYDHGGNTAAISVFATPTILQETSTTRTGAWTSKSFTSYRGGKSHSSSTKNVSLTWTFIGRSAAQLCRRRHDGRCRPEVVHHPVPDAIVKIVVAGTDPARRTHSSAPPLRVMLLVNSG
ncbi:hypothetical protein [Streptomyces sp. NPDC059743]|uniref:hypothetical protein n=1 Tax=Streptomyces sp. NPDC059743 TaxID=3346928 RepID=UPI00364C8D25